MTDPTTIDVAALESYKAVLRFADVWSDQDGPDAINSASDDRGDHELKYDDLRTVLHYVIDLIDERDGHRKRQREAEQALIMLLAREGGTVKFTPAEQISAPGDGSFVSTQEIGTGNMVLGFRPAKRYGRRSDERTGSFHL
jgi:hypothetical protein